MFFQIDLYLRPFKYEVWIVILLSMPVVAAAIYVIKKLSPLKDKEVDQFDKILLHVYGALMSQGNQPYALTLCQLKGPDLLRVTDQSNWVFPILY